MKKDCSGMNSPKTNNSIKRPLPRNWSLLKAKAARLASSRMPTTVTAVTITLFLA
ncbi:hypothetical protein D3C73_1129550 [compost metagenome]